MSDAPIKINLLNSVIKEEIDLPDLILDQNGEVDFLEIKEELAEGSKVESDRETLLQSKVSTFPIRPCFINLHRGTDPDEIISCERCKTSKSQGAFGTYETTHEGPYQQRTSFPSTSKRRKIERTNLKSFATRIKKHREEKLDGQSQKNLADLNIGQREGKFKCSECLKSFDKKSKLITHLRTIAEKPYKCYRCQRRFARVQTLNKHLEVIHSETKPYKCSVCLKHFAKRSRLRYHHLQVHSEEKPYECNICGKTFSVKYYLMSHLRVHTREKPYECNNCGKTFSDKPYLKSHLRVHTREKPYTCNQCTKSFAHSSSLSVHRRVHSGEKPYKCNICQKRFTRNSYFKQHQKAHADEKPKEKESKINL